MKYFLSILQKCVADVSNMHLFISIQTVLDSYVTCIMSEALPVSCEILLCT